MKGSPQFRQSGAGVVKVLRAEIRTAGQRTVPFALTHVAPVAEHATLGTPATDARTSPFDGLQQRVVVRAEPRTANLQTVYEAGAGTDGAPESLQRYAAGGGAISVQKS